MQSALSHLECSKCGTRYDADVRQQLCACGAPLLARYDLAAAAKTFTKSGLEQREDSLWRYAELLPLRDPVHRLNLSERVTPVIPLTRTGPDIAIDALFLKDEARLPTGSFKARGAAVGLSRAHELGVRAFGMPTNGNAGGAWTAYAARASIQAFIVMPKSAPPVFRLECTMAGAELQLVDGRISDAGRIVADVVRERDIYDASTLKEPYRVEGKKTIGFELAEQFEWNLPDVIIFPTGGGVGLIGIYKAMLELRELGLIDERMPRLVAVQAEGCAPLVQAWRDGKHDSVFWEDAHTVAFGMNVPKALGDFLVLDALYATGGAAIAVSDKTILEMQRRVVSGEGIFICPEGAATFAAAAQLRAQGWIRDRERVLLINTGTGLKYGK